MVIGEYYQPDSDQYCIDGYQFFRLNTLLSSPGDIYESKQSGHSFVLGPQSDVANVAIAYFDDQVNTFLNQTQIGPGRGWSGRIDARNEAKYAPSGRPGRILFWNTDLYDPNYLPTGFTPNADSLIQVTPRLDVIEYFTPGAPTPARDDRTFSFQELNYPVGQVFVVMPYWGRKSASVRITNKSSGNVTFTLYGVNYYMNDQYKALEVQLDTAVIGPNNQRLYVVKEQVDGMFDALMIKADNTNPDGPTPIQVITSDTPV